MAAQVAGGNAVGKVWNSTLERKKPFKAKDGWSWRNRQREIKRKTDKPLKKSELKKVSKSQRRRLREYGPEQRRYLELHPWCEICIARKMDPRPATEVHHARGRAGKLISDTRFFKASCFYCRMWPHENPKEARRVGVLAEAKDWNVYPRENGSFDNIEES